MSWRGLKVSGGALLEGDGLSLPCDFLYHGNSSVSGNKEAHTNHPRFMVKNKANVLHPSVSDCRSHSCK